MICMALCLPELVFTVTLFERYFHDLSDAVAVLWILTWIALIPACVVCGAVLVVFALKNANSKMGKIIGIFAGIAEIVIGVVIGLGLSGMKFIPPQT